MERVVSGSTSEVVMESSKKIAETEWPRMALVPVVSDQREHSIDSGGK